MSSLSLSDFELRRVPKNRAHLPRTSSGSMINQKIDLRVFIVAKPCRAVRVQRSNRYAIVYLKTLCAAPEPPQILIGNPLEVSKLLDF